MTRRKRRKQAARPADVDKRPGSEWEPTPSLEAEWISEELVARTQKVWSDYLGREVPPEEATEMLLNVRMIADAFYQASIDAAEEREQEAEASKAADAHSLDGWCPEI